MILWKLEYLLAFPFLLVFLVHRDLPQSPVTEQKKEYKHAVKFLWHLYFLFFLKASFSCLWCQRILYSRMSTQVGSESVYDLRNIELSFNFPQTTTFFKAGICKQFCWCLNCVPADSFIPLQTPKDQEFQTCGVSLKFCVPFTSLWCLKKNNNNPNNSLYFVYLKNVFFFPFDFRIKYDPNFFSWASPTESLNLSRWPPRIQKRAHA